MKIFKQKISIADGLKELEFNQFLQVANFFGISVIDRENSSTSVSSNSKIDMSKIKTRRDFDVMRDEILQAYNKMPRHSRRSIDRIFSKIIAANRRAKNIITHEQIAAYSAAKTNIGEVMRAIQEQGEDVNGE